MEQQNVCSYLFLIPLFFDFFQARFSTTKAKTKEEKSMKGELTF